MDFYWVSKKEKILLDVLAHKDLSKKFSMVGSDKNAEFWEFFNGTKTVQIGVPRWKDPNFKSEYNKVVK